MPSPDKNYDKSDPQTIQNMFGSIAKRYDRANAVLSLGLHRYWNHSLVKHVAQAARKDLWLDLCSGTGDIAFTYLKKQTQPQKTILVDFCPEMLACAQEKAKRLSLLHHPISFVQADVQELPLEDSTVSAATMAYGIRNVKDPQKCFSEVYRVLAPNGVFGILELTKPTQPMIRWGHNVYLQYLLPYFGKWLTHNQEAYRYLCNTIQGFILPADLEQMLRRAGFKETSCQALTFGTATLLIGKK